MAKITDLPAVDVLNGDEHLPIVQGGATKRSTLNALRALIVPYLQSWYRGDPGPAGPSNNTRTTLAKLKAASPSDLTSLYDGSLWVWTPGDYSARADDPEVVAGDGVALAAGAWLRRSSDLRHDSSRIHIARDGDNAPSINRLLARADVRTVILPAGLLSIGQSLIVPADTTLVMQPDTILRAQPDFVSVDLQIAGIVLAGSRAAVTGGTVDMNKLGRGLGDRWNGVAVSNGARGCRRVDITVMNCTGYAIYDSGADNRLSMPSSTNIRVRTFNSQIHYEPQGADGSTYIDCHAGDGDGDIVCLSWYHPLVGSRNISFIRCTGKGIAGAAFDMTGNIAPLSNIRVIDCDIELLNGAVCLSASPGWQGIAGLHVRGGRFKTSYIAAQMTDTVGTFDGVTLIGSSAIEVFESKLDCEGCHAIAGTDPQGSAVGRGLLAYGSSDIRWNGGSIVVTGPPETSTAIGNVRISADTRQVPAPPVGFVARSEAVGLSDFQNDGGKCFANIRADYGDIAKVHLSLSVRSSIDGYRDSAVPQMTWSEVERGFIRVRVTGVAYTSDYRLSWHLIESA